MLAYFKSRQGNIPELRRKKTRRGRLVTTIARILHMDLTDFAPHAAHQFGTHELTQGSHLKLLRRSAENKDHWANATVMMKEADLEKWKERERERTNTRRTQNARAQRAVQQPEQPDPQPGIQAPTPVVLRMGGAAPVARGKGRPPGSKNKPKAN